MKRIFFLTAALVLAAVILAACSSDPEPTATPEPSTACSLYSRPQLHRRSQPTSHPARRLLLEIPTPTFYPVDNLSSVLDSLSPDVDISGTLSAQCAPDGILDSAAVVSSCGILAAQDIESFSFVAEVDLLSLFPVDGSGGSDFSMTLNGIMVRDGRLQFEMVLDIAGATSTIDGVFIGNDIYFQDTETGQWYEGDPPDTEFLTALQLVGILIAPNDPTASFDGIVDLADGSRGYVLSSEFAGQGGETGLDPGSVSSVTRTVDATDFLTREVRLADQGSDGEPREYITISYSGYNEPFEVEPPDELLPLSN